jgi:hypothetical protein
MVDGRSGQVNEQERRSLELAKANKMSAAWARFYVGTHDGKVVLKVQSKSKATVRYEVVLDGDRVVSCDCPAYGPCCHKGVGALWIARRNAWDADHLEERQGDDPQTAA